MDTLLHAALSNAGWAAALALVATAAGRVFRHRPALVHGLWLLVLLKLVTPSLVPFSPDWLAAGPAAVPLSQAVASREEEAAGPEAIAEAHIALPLSPDEPRFPNPPRATVAWPWREALLGAWLVGVAVWGWVVVAQVARFRRIVGAARRAPDSLHARAGRLAARLGLRRPPGVWLVPAPIPPMLWAPVGPPKLLLPEELWGRLDERQQDTVLVHELAHIRRRDHWVRRVEAVVLGLYWWNPVAWWARHRVEEAEEQCCDAWVVRALPEAVEAYAEALVATAAFLSGPRTFRPLGATGVGRVPPLRRRLSMILHDPAIGPMPRPAPRGARLLAPLALVALLVLPGWATAPPASPGPERPEVHISAVEPPAQDGVPAQDGDPSVQEAGRGPGAPAAVGVGIQEPGVVVSRPIPRELSDFADYVGRVEAGQTVEIRARVGGMLIEAHPLAGRVVEKGEVLFEIDPRPYRAELTKAEAEVRRAESGLKRRAAARERALALFARAAITQEEVAQIEGEHDEARAVLEAAQAVRDLAQLHNGSTIITAPIRGKVGRPQISAGNLVVADTTPLATITSLDPMGVLFEVDERTVLKLGRKRPEGQANAGLGAGLPVQIGLVDEEGFPRRGRIEWLDTRVNPETGTLRVRAIIPNTDGLLMPGLFARIRLVMGEPRRALIIPSGAVRIDDKGGHVLVVDDQDRVERRPVKTRPIADDQQEVIEGLKAEDWVVVAGFAGATPGATVHPRRAAPSP